ncbi:MAG: hypothetical protein H6980_06145 [Gammaproteobacteria bacterium]|nr:hypothetical protein [Gammaproteobacteria bacterium]
MNDEEQNNQGAEPVPPKKRRGRPPKIQAPVTADATPRKQGRAATAKVVGGNPPKAAQAEVPERRVVVRKGADVARVRAARGTAKAAAKAETTAAPSAKHRGRPRKVVPVSRDPAPERRIVLKQGVSVAAYRKSLAEAAAASEAAATPRASGRKDTRRAVSAEPGYAPPPRRIVVREGALDAYLASLRAPDPVVEEPVPAVIAPVIAASETAEPEQGGKPLRRKRVVGAPRASRLAALVRMSEGEAARLVIRDVVPELVHEGEPQPPSKRPGRKPVAVPKKRRAKAAPTKGGARRGRKPRKPGVLSAGARRRTVSPE